MGIRSEQVAIQDARCWSVHCDANCLNALCTTCTTRSPVGIDSFGGDKCRTSTTEKQAGYPDDGCASQADSSTDCDNDCDRYSGRWCDGPLINHSSG